MTNKRSHTQANAEEVESPPPEDVSGGEMSETEAVEPPKKRKTATEQDDDEAEAEPETMDDGEEDESFELVDLEEFDEDLRGHFEAVARLFGMSFERQLDLLRLVEDVLDETGEKSMRLTRMYELAAPLGILESVGRGSADVLKRLEHLSKSFKAGGAADTHPLIDKDRVLAICIAMFWSENVPSYAARKQAIVKAVLNYLQSKPHIINEHHGNMFFEPANAKRLLAELRKFIRYSIENLRSNTKTTLNQSLGRDGEEQAWTLAQLVEALFKNNVNVTRGRIIRVALLRKYAVDLNVKIDSTDKDGNTVWKSNREFWHQVDQKLEPIMKNLSQAKTSKAYKAAKNKLVTVYDNDLALYRGSKDDFKLLEKDSTEEDVSMINQFRA